MAYINREFESLSFGNLTIKGTKNGSSFYGMVSPIGISYDTVNDLFVAKYPASGIPLPGEPLLEVTSETLDFTCSISGNTSSKELVSPSISTTSFPSKLKHGLGTSTLNFDYVKKGSYKVTINGESAVYNNDGGQDPSTIFGSFTLSRMGQQEGSADSPASTSKLTVSTSSADYALEDSYTYLYSATNSYGDFNNKVTFNAGRIEIEGNINTSTSQGLGVSYSNTSGSYNYKYNITDLSYGTVSPNSLMFSGIGQTYTNGVKNTNFSWSGLTSPTAQYYGNSRVTISLMKASGLSDIQETWTPLYNYQSSGSYGWTVDDPPPEQIGGVKLLNPEIINDYTQSVVINENTGQTEEVRNQRIMMIPELASSATIPMKVVKKPFIDLEELECVNGSGKFIDPLLNDNFYYSVTDFNSDNNLYADKTFIKQNDLISTRTDRVLEEAGDLPTNYKQRHNTKFRYLNLKLSNNGNDLIMPNLYLIMTYKGYDDFEERKVRYDKVSLNNNCVKDEIQNVVFDTTKWTGYGGKDFQDDYMSICTPEEVQNYNYEQTIREGTTSIVEDTFYTNFIKEPFNTAYSYGQNLVGSIEIRGFDFIGKKSVIEVPTYLELPLIGDTTVIYKTKDKKDYYRYDTQYYKQPTEYKIYGLFGQLGEDLGQGEDVYQITFLAGEEFQEPGQIGVFPDLDNLAELSRPMKSNRHARCIINGKHSFEIPVNEKTVTNSGLEIWSMKYASILKHIKEDGKMVRAGNRKVYPIDDLGEIEFAINTYTPDNEGNLPVKALFNSSSTAIGWLKPAQTKTDTLTIPVTPMFDYLKGKELEIYLSSYPNINCRGEYGAKITGINSKVTYINIYDTSNYADETVGTDKNVYSSGVIDYKYITAKHGTKSTLISGARRLLNRVIDGMKYVFSDSVYSGKILRNEQLLILQKEVVVDGKTEHKILQGGETQ